MNVVNPLSSHELAASRPNPQRGRMAVQRFTLLPWWLLVIIWGLALFIASRADSTLYREAWGQIQGGIWTTIWISVVSYTFATLLALFIGVLRRPSRSPVYNFLVYQPLTVYVEFVRGIPTLVLLFYVVLALVPQLIDVSNQLGEELLAGGINPYGLGAYLTELTVRDVPNEYRVILALAISYSAFMSEIFRAGIESIERGQREAAASLGLSRWQILGYVVLPQAVRNVLPPLGNDFIALLKESSLVSAVGVADITRLGRDFNASTFTLFPGYNTMALTYLALTVSLAVLVKTLEWFLSRNRRST
jgi:polar amino acid transport system permease protein